MPVVATCECGASFNLKDEYAGKRLQCPQCQKTMVAPPLSPVTTREQADPAFARDKFLLRQKVVSISEKYEVSDEENRPILFVERPAHLLQNLGAALVGAIAFVLVLLLCLFAGARIFENRDTGLAVMLPAGMLLGLAAAVCVGTPLSAKRHVTFYRDPGKMEKLMDVLQDRKFQPIKATFTVRDRDGGVLCTLRKNIIYNLVRRRWSCFGPDGSLLCRAKEDSVGLSLLRRLLGPLFGLLRTNFIILPVDSDNVIGEFNRKFTLFDRYVLDLTMDPGRTLDRRIALALGVMLDTGERR